MSRTMCLAFKFVVIRHVWVIDSGLFQQGCDSTLLQRRRKHVGAEGHGLQFRHDWHHDVNSNSSEVC